MTPTVTVSVETWTLARLMWKTTQTLTDFAPLWTRAHSIPPTTRTLMICATTWIAVRSMPPTTVCGDVDSCNDLTGVGAGCVAPVTTTSTSSFVYEGLSQEWIIGLSVGASVVVATVIIIVIVVLRKKEEDEQGGNGGPGSRKVGATSVAGTSSPGVGLGIGIITCG